MLSVLPVTCFSRRQPPRRRDQGRRVVSTRIRGTPLVILAVSSTPAFEMNVVHRLVTDVEPCPYLRERSQQLEMASVSEISPAEYEAELARGSRRFADTLFRPACPACRECIPLRVPLAAFQPSRSQRRVRRRNADVELEIGIPSVSDDRIALYIAFHEDRHHRRGWPAPRMDAYEYFFTFVDNVVPTIEFRYRLSGRLVGIAYVDETPRSFNSIYAFFDPELARRSLGTHDVLVEIEEARRRGKDYLYLGYFVAGCLSMEYKAGFRPCERLIDGEWALSPDVE